MTYAANDKRRIILSSDRLSDFSADKKTSRVGGFFIFIMHLIIRSPSLPF